MQIALNGITSDEQLDKALMNGSHLTRAQWHSIWNAAPLLRGFSAQKDSLKCLMKMGDGTLIRIWVNFLRSIARRLLADEPVEKSGSSWTARVAHARLFARSSLRRSIRG